MGLHTIQFTWNITIKEPHQISVTRIGRVFTDTLEIELDGELIAKRVVNPLLGMGFGRGSQHLSVDGRRLEIHWKYDASTNDPDSIVLVDDDKVIARYGSRKALRSATIKEEVSPENLIPLVPPQQVSSNFLGFNRHWRLSTWFSKASGQFGTPALPPFVPQGQSLLALDELGREIGFQDEALLHPLASHSQHFKNWRRTFFILYLTPYVLFFILVYVIWSPFFDFIFDYDVLGIFVLWLLLFAILPFVLSSIIQRIALLISWKYEKETLCVAAILYILVELNQDDVLTHSQKRQLLTSRLNYLANQTMLLAARYKARATSEKNQMCVQKHFASIASYLHERETWVHMPTASTLENLRSDLRELAPIYITGMYGEFTRKPDDDMQSEPEETEARPLLQRIGQRVPQFAFGIVLPIALLMVSSEQQSPIPGIAPPTATLLLLSWLAIGVDSALNLGLIANAATLARQIK